MVIISRFEKLLARLASDGIDLAVFYGSQAQDFAATG